MNGLPVGEFFSGFTMGFMIMLISVYINKTGSFDWSWSNLLKIWLVALPCELWISNLMLANNICDAQEDEDNHRHTIIHFIGVQQGLNSFTTKNVIAFLAIITAKQKIPIQSGVTPALDGNLLFRCGDLVFFRTISDERVTGR